MDVHLWQILTKSHRVAYGCLEGTEHLPNCGYLIRKILKCVALCSTHCELSNTELKVLKELFKRSPITSKFECMNGRQHC